MRAGIVASARVAAAPSGGGFVHTGGMADLMTTTSPTGTIPLGPPHPNRTVVVVVTTRGSSALVRYPTGVTIGGTQAVLDGGVTLTIAPHVTRIFRAPVPLGEDAPVTVTLNGTSSHGFAAQVFVIDSLLEKVDEAELVSDGADVSIAVTPASHPGGLVVAGTGTRDNAAEMVVSGLDFEYAELAATIGWGSTPGVAHQLTSIAPSPSVRHTITAVTYREV